ncbi:MAG: M28 family peptidase [Thermaerobacter sp.]|nr:M28 family peptidase [Thermaerobacter sp.]
MPELIRSVRALAETIGPRPAGSAAEAAAARHVRERWESLGLTVQEETFRTVTTFSWPQGAVYLLGVAAGLATLLRPDAGVLLGLAAVILFWDEVDGPAWVSRLLARATSRNLWTRIPPREQPRRTLVVSAHLDSSRAAAAFDPRRVQLFRATFLGVAAALATVPLLAAAALWWPGIAPAALLPTAYLAVTTGLLVQRELCFRFVPGANDNASGVAVLLGLAEDLCAAAPTRLEVWLLATGAEEAGLTGMRAFLARHGPRLAGAWFLNLDNLGRGGLVYTTAEGMLRARPTSPELQGAARRAADRLGIPARPQAFRTMSTDALPALARGLPAMSILALDERNLLPDWHWYTDVADNVDASNLEDACRLALGMVEELDGVGRD